MCTNYVPTRGDRLREFFDAAPPPIALREETYPGYLAPIIRGPGNHETESQEQATAACFGLIPSWSRDGKNFRFCYNARAETIAEKPSFRHAWRQQQRCVIPVDAFFEPNYESGRPVRWRIGAANGEPLALAGIWEAWRKPGPAPDRQASGTKVVGPPEAHLIDQDWLISFSMVTINADQHPLMNQFHAPGDEKRSVVMLEPEQTSLWLEGSTDQVRKMLTAYEADRLVARPDPRPRGPKKPTKAAPPIPIPQRKLF
ncbi:MAG: SOS response-associated peptidase [Burkholderiaceae bacterium]